MQTLYTYISPKEREEIAEAPINKAVKNYRDTRNTLLAIYLALVFILVAAGAFTLIHATTAPPKAAQSLSLTVSQPSSPAPAPSAASSQPAAAEKSGDAAGADRRPTSLSRRAFRVPALPPPYQAGVVREMRSVKKSVTFPA